MGHRGHRGQRGQRERERERERKCGALPRHVVAVHLSLCSQLHTFSVHSVTQPANINKVSVFVRVKMASTDGVQPSPNDLHAENVMPAEVLDVSSWWTALQANSILASYDADCLQHIFSRLKLFDAMPLGFTCRRLYYHFKESQKKTRTLMLETDDGSERNYFFEPVLSIKNFRSVALKFAPTYSNLRSLSVTTCCHPDNFAALLTQLTELPLLTTLNLKFRSFFYFNDTKGYTLLVHLWRPLSQLQHSSLRHLKLNLERFYSFDFNYEIPPLHIPCQLSSLTFVYSEANFSVHHKLIQALSKEHLTPGKGVCIELTFFEYEYKLVSIEPELLPYVTSINMSVGWNYEKKPEGYELALVSMFSYLPLMRHLQQLILRIRCDTNSTDYPNLLSAISSLTQLQKLFIIIEDAFDKDCYSGELSPKWSRAVMPVLPMVRDLSLFCTIWNHDDIVEKFHLSHCFPQLRQLRCHFKHDMKCKKYFGNPQLDFHLCGQKLSRGLSELMPETILKKIEFTFVFKGEFYFSSLKSLLSEKKRIEQLEMANSILSDSLSACDDKCAKLEEEVRLLKKQLAQSKLTL